MKKEKDPVDERTLCAVWETHAVTGAEFRCCNGERIRVISPGVRNRTSGPDYGGAVLLVDGELATGDVEIHVREGDWFAHGHQHDQAYSRVILHLVGVRPHTIQLPFPTLISHELVKASAPGNLVKMSYSQYAPTVVAPEAPLLAQLAWDRLLRRSAGVMGELPGKQEVTEKASTGDAAWLQALVRRAFVVRLFDSLGFAANREQMRAVAQKLLRSEKQLAGATAEQITSLLEDIAAFPEHRLPAKISAGSEMPRDDVRKDVRTGSRIRGGAPDNGNGIVWRYNVRPANSPVRRLRAAAVLLHRIYSEGLLERLFDILGSSKEKCTISPFVEGLVVNGGNGALLGEERAHASILHALLPVALATAAVSGNHVLAERVCIFYRQYPTLTSDTVVRRVERRIASAERLRGGFWQQGAHEYYQRYMSPADATASSVAEHQALYTVRNRGSASGGTHCATAGPQYVTRNQPTRQVRYAI